MRREFDITLFGATGFVGRLVAQHLAEAAPDTVRIALAGRSMDRLTEVRHSVGSGAATWPLVLADSSDPRSLRDLAARSRVLVSTVGPYQRHGLPLVEACAAAGTDYADLTGEVLFVAEAIERAHDTARETGARIVVSCGFDSVPSDLGVLLLHQTAQSQGAGGLTDTTLWLRQARGGISGGTVDSLRTQLTRMRQEPALRRVVLDPEALSGGAGAASEHHDRWLAEDRWLPAKDDDRWAAPFVMAPYNTRVVRRSHALTGQGYGPRFRYREVVDTGRGVKAAVAAYAMTVGLGLVVAGMTTPLLGRLINRALPAPGQGPSEEQRRNGAFRTETITTTEDGSRYAATVAAQGDPGYAATSVMLGQAALCLLATRGADRSGGVLTPATAIGPELIEALRAQGFTLDVDRLDTVRDRVEFEPSRTRRHATPTQLSAARTRAGTGLLSGSSTHRRPASVQEVSLSVHLPRPAAEVIDFCLQGDNFSAIMPDPIDLLWVSSPSGELGGLYVFRWWFKRIIPIKWVAFVDSLDEGREFSDLQVRGAFRYFHHTHTAEVDGDGCVYTDTIRFASLLGPRLDHRLLVPQIKATFDQRHTRMQRLLTPDAALRP